MSQEHAIHRANYIPFLPLFRFLYIVMTHGGLSWKGVWRLLPWLIKLTLFEPLRWVEVLLFEKRISNTRIVHPPLFILGHYRSGTTFLQRIFNEDKRFGTMSVFQQVMPDMMFLFEKPLTRSIQWISDLFKAQNHFHRVPYDWSYPGEEDVGLMAMASLYSSSWGFIFPEKFKSVFETFFIKKDQRMIRGWKRDYLYLIKRIALKHKNKPLVLKSPPNTARVHELLELFPDAKFIYLTREPDEMFVSTQRLWKVVKNFHSLGPTRHVNFDELIYTSMDIFRQNWIKDMSQLDPHQYIEVNYHDLVQQPAVVMESVYSQLNLPAFKECESTIRQFLEEQKSYQTIQHIIPEEVKQNLQHRLRLRSEETKRS